MGSAFLHESKWPQLSFSVMGCEANNYLCSGSCNSEERIFEHKLNSGFLMQSVHETR